jgi:hypothetical protein
MPSCPTSDSNQAAGGLGEKDMRDVTIKKTPTKGRTRAMRAEYDFSLGVRGKYVEEYRHGTNVRLLDPELVAAFPDSKSVNDALRVLVEISARNAARRRT